MDILYLLDRLEEVVTSGTRVPLSSRVLIDEQECLEIVDQIRLALPEELKTARRVLNEKDQILAEANDRSARIIERAEDQAAQRIDDHELVLAAQERAREVVDRAGREAEEIRRDADAYAYRVFTNLHSRLRQIDEVVREGLDTLQRD